MDKTIGSHLAFTWVRLCPLDCCGDGHNSRWLTEPCLFLVQGVYLNTDCNSWTHLNRLRMVLAEEVNQGTYVQMQPCVLVPLVKMKKGFKVTSNTNFRRVPTLTWVNLYREREEKRVDLWQSCLFSLLCSCEPVLKLQYYTFSRYMVHFKALPSNCYLQLV